MREGISRRLNQAIDQLPDIPKTFGRNIKLAELFNETPQAIRLWLGPNKKTGKVTIPSLEKLPSICDILDVSIDWLLTGHEPMRLSDAVPMPEGLQVDANTLSTALDYAATELSGSGYFELPSSAQAKVLILLYEAVYTNTELNEEFGKLLKMNIKLLK